MSIEAMKQTLDLSTPTLREMVTRHAAAIDPRATLEDMPEALSFQIDMARALLKEFTAIQQAEARTDVRCEGCGYMTHHREHMGCVRAAKQFTHPAPGVPELVMVGDVVFAGIFEDEVREVKNAAVIRFETTEELAAWYRAQLTAAQAQKGQQ